MLREPKLLWTSCRLKGGVLLVERRVILLTDAPTRAHMSTRQLQLHPFLPVEPTLFLLLPSRTTLMGESIMWLWKEAQEAPDVVIGMFLINDISIVVLFDSRASHSFISVAYVGKHNMPLALLKCQMIVSSLEGDMPARQLCPKVNLKIRE
jgi:hypothetical protein